MASPNVTISACLPEESAIKNLRMAKTYRQQMARTLNMLEALTYLQLFVTAQNRSFSRLDPFTAVLRGHDYSVTSKV